MAANYLSKDDYERGRQAIVYYHNAALKYDSYDGKSFQELVNDLTAKKGGKYFMDSLGASILAGEMSLRAVQDAMEQVANDYKGVLPQNLTTFTSYLAGKAVMEKEQDLTSMIADVSSNTVADLLVDFAELGTFIKSNLGMTVLILSSGLLYLKVLK